MRRLLTLPILTPLLSDLSDAEISFFHSLMGLNFKCAHSFLCTFSIVFFYLMIKSISTYSSLFLVSQKIKSVALK